MSVDDAMLVEVDPPPKIATVGNIVGKLSIRGVWGKDRPAKRKWKLMETGIRRRLCCVFHVNVETMSIRLPDANVEGAKKHEPQTLPRRMQYRVTSQDTARTPWPFCALRELQFIMEDVGATC